MPMFESGFNRRTVVTLLAGSALTTRSFAAPFTRHPAAGPAIAPSLEAGFADPPPAARPRSWWHWMNGNVTLDGIEKDLAWMHRIGLGGVHVFDAALTTPQVVERPVKYMSTEWRRAFLRSAELLDAYNMEMGIAASPGWSETGGPWVKPEDAMKKLVWTEQVIDGGRPFHGPLRKPPSVPGIFQDISIPPPPVGEAPPPPPHFYRDELVFAFPDPRSPGVLPRADYRDSTGAALDTDILEGEDYATSVEVTSGDRGGLVAIFGTPVTARSLEFYAADIFNIFFGSSIKPVLEASDDGKTWRKVADFFVSGAPTTVSFAAVTARWFRLRLPRLVTFSGPGPVRIKIARFRLSPDARLNAFEMKAAFSVVPDYYALDANAAPEIAGIDPDDVVVLTPRVTDGLLDWTPPRPGRWRVVRMGYSLTGRQNHPAVPEATGLEIDKYDARAVRAYIEQYLDMYADATGSRLFGRRGLQALLTDSTEVGSSNWTPGLFAHFRRLRGYDPTPWMPTLIGVIVGSRARSDAFLYDYRRTLADLMASEHYGTIAKVGHERGLFVYAESLEAGRPTLGDDLDMRRFADIPMAALWTWDRGEPHTRPALIADCKGASSVAHIYGQNVTAAESMTSANALYAQSPADLKRVIDLEFALGINRIVIHTSPHQPVDDRKPGLSLQIFGQAFTRHNTWAGMARPWIDYMARSSFLLQQGCNVADVAYFYGEDGSPTALYQLRFVADAPSRYAFDYVGALPLLTLAGIEDGCLTFPSGARYHVLYLGGSSARMTLPVLRKLEELAKGGLTIVGAPPQATPSGADDPAAFAALRGRLWSGTVETPIGKGRTLALADVEAALARIGVGADFEIEGSRREAEFLFVHRLLDDGDVYFVNNRRDRPEKVTARFRVRGKVPAMWRADTGEMRPLSYRTDGAHTVIDLEAAAEDAFFVVFRQATTAYRRQVAPMTKTRLVAVRGPWSVRFEPGRGAPEGTMRMLRLMPLDQSDEPGIRYFSGIASYVTSIDAPHRRAGGGATILDLGEVGDIAQVFVNGREAGIVWKAPYRLDVTVYWRSGRNEVEVRVANLWLNRLVGDLQPGAVPLAYVSNQTATAQTPLRRSGLIGPVEIWETSK